MDAHGIDWRFAVRVASRTWLPIWFIVLDAFVLAGYARHGYLGIDAVLYRGAATALLSGGDPWAIQSTGLSFAGPPPTLLAFVPLAFLPEPLTILVVIGAGLVAAIWVVRRLDLPLWWLAFPPMFESLVVGNPDSIVLALLLVPGPAAGIAAALKIYAVVPLLLQRRWGALLISAAVALVSLPLLPAFLADLDAIGRSLASQTGGMSAWGSWLIVPTVLSLISLRGRGASWLVVPGLWPLTQVHYATMSLPAVRRLPIAAALIGLGTPLSAALAIIVGAVESRLREAEGLEGGDVDRTSTRSRWLRESLGLRRPR
jgi:hypothetical protein